MFRWYAQPFLTPIASPRLSLYSLARAAPASPHGAQDVTALSPAALV